MSQPDTLGRDRPLCQHRERVSVYVGLRPQQFRTLANGVLGLAEAAE